MVLCKDDMMIQYKCLSNMMRGKKRLLHLNVEREGIICNMLGEERAFIWVLREKELGARL